jgi:hypothetical protein
MRASLFSAAVLAAMAIVSSTPTQAQAQIVYPLIDSGLGSPDNNNTNASNTNSTYPVYSSGYTYSYPDYYGGYWAPSYWAGAWPWYHPYPYYTGYRGNPRFGWSRGWNRR